MGIDLAPILTALHVTVYSLFYALTTAICPLDRPTHRMCEKGEYGRLL